jgi:methionine-gamma-lyase
MMNPDFGYGGMLAVDLETHDLSNMVMQAMQDDDVGYLAVSLGYFKTLFSCSGHSTSSEVPEEIQRDIGLSDGLTRFSIGLDNDIERTWKKMERAFKLARVIS